MSMMQAVLRMGTMICELSIPAERISSGCFGVEEVLCLVSRFTRGSGGTRLVHMIPTASEHCVFTLKRPKTWYFATSAIQSPQPHDAVRRVAIRMRKRAGTDRQAVVMANAAGRESAGRCVAGASSAWWTCGGTVQFRG